MAPTLQDVLASRSNISNKVILTREMLQNEDVVSTCLSNIADKSRGYSHLTLDDNLKKLIIVKEDNMKLEVETDFIQNKFAKRDYTQPKVTTHGNNNTNKNIIDILATHNIHKLHLA